MKMIKNLAVAFAALAAVSCVKDNIGGAETKTFQASFTDAVGVKTTIAIGAEQSLVSWETTDRVSILTASSN